MRSPQTFARYRVVLRRPLNMRTPHAQPRPAPHEPRVALRRRSCFPGSMSLFRLYADGLVTLGDNGRRSPPCQGYGVRLGRISGTIVRASRHQCFGVMPRLAAVLVRPRFVTWRTSKRPPLVRLLSLISCQFSKSHHQLPHEILHGSTTPDTDPTPLPRTSPVSLTAPHAPAFSPAVPCNQLTRMLRLWLCRDPANPLFFLCDSLTPPATSPPSEVCLTTLDNTSFPLSTEHDPLALSSLPSFSQWKSWALPRMSLPSSTYRRRSPWPSHDTPKTSGEPGSDIDRLKKEADGLEKASNRVNQLLHGPNRATLEGAEDIHSLLDDSRSLLNELLEKLNPGSRHKAMSRIGLRSLKWPLESKDAEKIAQSLSDKRLAIFSYLQTCVPSPFRLSMPTNEIPVQRPHPRRRSKTRPRQAASRRWRRIRLPRRGTRRSVPSRDPP